MLTSAELTDWRAYDRLHPLDHARRIEAAVADVASLIFNANRAKNADPMTPADFLHDRVAAERERLGLDADGGDAAPHTPAAAVANVDAVFGRLAGLFRPRS